MQVLNVGAGGRLVAIPPWFEGWDVVRLDIDKRVEPDLLMDARDLEFYPTQFDACYCSHNLEHYNMHDAGMVVRGMRHVLKEDGFADVLVPNVGKILREAGANGWDLDTFLYQTTGGPICVRDVLYGYERQREFSDHPEYMTHRNGFSGRTLSLLMQWCGFEHVYVGDMEWELRAVGFTKQPDAEKLASVGLVLE